MSMVTTTRVQRREKSNPSQKQSQATAEEIRLAQIIGSNVPDEDNDIQDNVAKVIEVTGTTEDKARTALYDANNDTNRAIELILESGSFEQTNEWETAGRRKNKTPHNSLKDVNTFDNETKEDTSPLSRNSQRASSHHRSKSNRTRGRSSDADLRIDASYDGRGGFGSREWQRGGRRGRGRGRDGSGRGGRQPGRGPRRFERYNQGRREQTVEKSTFENTFDKDNNDGFDSFKASNNTESAQVDSVTWPSEEDWGSLELPDEEHKVGTWSNKDLQQSENDPLSEAWGTDSWNDDLTESKVFQSKTKLATNVLPSQPNHGQSYASVPQMGERIDIGALFKKNPETRSAYSQQMNNSHLVGQTSMPLLASTQSTTQSVLQQLQGQSSSLFSDNKTVKDIESQSSHLFTSFERQASNPSASNSSSIGQYDSRSSNMSYSQYNGKLMTNSHKENSSKLLGSFGERFKSSDPCDTSAMISQMSNLTKSSFPSLNQVNSESVIAAHGNFSQAQQRQATESVKASLGLPAVNTELKNEFASQSRLSSLSPANVLSDNTLSFGAPQPIRQPKQQRRKPPLSSKIPASAVEMPGAGNDGSHELSGFDFQFGSDDNTLATTEFSNINGINTVSGMPSTRNTLFNQNILPSQTSSVSQMPIRTEESVTFSTSTNNQSQQQLRDLCVDSSQQPSDTLISTQHHPSQRYFKSSAKSNEAVRGPPGIAHPQSLSSGGSEGGLSGETMQTGELSSSAGSFASSRLVTSGNMPLSGLPHESAMANTQSMATQSHLYYTSTTLTQQPQQQYQSDLSRSAGRSLRSPVPTGSLSDSLQGSPKSHVTGTPSKSVSGSSSAAISSLASGLDQSHIGAHVGSVSTTTSLSTSGGYVPINMGYSVSNGPSQSSSIILSSTHNSYHDVTSVTSPSNSLDSKLIRANPPISSPNTTIVSSQVGSVSKAGPPNLALGLPPLLHNQYGIPMGPGLMAAYPPEALYGYADPLMAVQSRVHQMPNYYDMYNAGSQPGSNNLLSREPSNATSQGKFSRTEPTSPTSAIGIIGTAGSGLPQQSAQHNTQIKASQTGTHQGQPYMNPPAVAPAYQSFQGLYYNAFGYTPMFAAAVPNAKPQVNVTSSFQQPGSGFASAHSTASVSASSGINLHDLQSQGYSKNHMAAYEKQQFHHHANTPPPTYNMQQTLAAVGNGTAAAPGISPYNQAPFMAMVPTHQPSIHLHVPQHGDIGQSVGSQRSQTSNPMSKAATKAPFGNTAGPYWGN